jgi:hypothetical protein
MKPIIGKIIACIPAPRTKKVGKKKAQRAALPKKIYAITEGRRFPIHDPYHATLALSFLLRTAGRHGPMPATARKVLAAVRKHWPEVVACEQDLVRKIKKAHKL